mgnify:CR=1 FL=1
MLRKSKGKQLRKQPKRRRTYSSSAVNFPRLNVPDTARKRRRRQKTEGVRFGLVTLKRILFSSRWISLGLLALSIFALVIIVQERRFYLTYIPVDGAVSFAPEEIVSASNLAGNHIFSADPGQAAANITELPGVISATVSLQWPNQVYIEIAEEKPVAVWQENGTSYGITSSGRLIPVSFPLTGLLQIIPETGTVGLSAPPVVNEEEQADPETEAVDELPPATEQTTLEESGTAAEEPPPEDADDQDLGSETRAKNDGEDTLVEGVETTTETSVTFVPQEVLQGALSLRKLRPSINELYYRPSDGLSYQDDRGWRVYFGTGMDMNQKLVLYETILADLITRGISPRYISVGNKGKPYYLAQ